MKKLLLLFAVLTTALTASAINFKVDGIHYSTTSDNGVKVTNPNMFSSQNPTYSGIINIPSTVTYGETTYTVTEIGNNTFAYCRDVTEVEIPNTVTTIGNQAFASTGLTKIKIPDSVTKLGECSFYNCGKLTSVEFSNSLTVIDYAMCIMCENLKEVKLPESLKEIVHLSFAGCSSLTEIELPSNLETIHPSVFGDCSSLAKITSLSTTPPSVSADSFSGVPYTTCIVNVPAESVEAYKAANGWKNFQNIEALDEQPQPHAVGEAFQAAGFTMQVTGVEPYTVALVSYGAATRAAAGEVVIPATVEDENGFQYTVAAIGAEAFAGHDELTAVTIPATVEEIGNRAFADCPNLALVVLESETPQSIQLGEQVFDHTSQPALSVPEGSQDAFAAADQWSEFQNITTSLRPILAETTPAPAYNLSGQRVGAGYKGIVVRGGKKVVRK